jgi:putative cell wall-binding protein
MGRGRRGGWFGAAAIAVVALVGYGSAPAAAQDLGPYMDTVHEYPTANGDTSAITAIASGPEGDTYFLSAGGTVSRLEGDQKTVDSFALDGPRATDGSTLVSAATDTAGLWIGDRGDDSVRLMKSFGSTTTIPIGATPESIVAAEPSGVWVATDDAQIVFVSDAGTVTHIPFQTDTPGRSVGIEAYPDNDDLSFVVPGQPYVWIVDSSNADAVTRLQMPGDATPTAFDGDRVALDDGTVADVSVGGLLGVRENPTPGAVIDGFSGAWFRETINGDESAVGMYDGTHWRVVEQHPRSVETATTVNGDGNVGATWVAHSTSGRSGIEVYQFDGTEEFLPFTAANTTSAAPTVLAMLGTPVFGTADGHIGVLDEIAMSRVSGTDRFATADSVAETAYPNGTSTVVVASGSSFPDALAAGPAAAKMGAPVLLVTPDEEFSLLGEIARLHATRAVIVGGDAAVDPTIESLLVGQLGRSAVDRIGGADRVQTSDLVARWAFGSSGATQAMVVTGTSAPDALTAGSAIGSSGPVLLVDGSNEAVGSGTTDTIHALGVTKVTIAGGTSAVSSGIEASLRAQAAVTRVAGADRYATADALAAAFHPAATKVFLATGESFADALAGSAWAAHEGAPLLLSTTDCVPVSTLETIAGAGTSAVTVLGGGLALSPRIDQLHSCSGPTWMPVS